jgi:hypothetical protein
MVVPAGPHNNSTTHNPRMELTVAQKGVLPEVNVGPIFSFRPLACPAGCSTQTVQVCSSHPELALEMSPHR